MEQQIQFFGQTPAQLISRPHEPRKPRSKIGPSCQVFDSPEAVKVYHPRSLPGSGGGGAAADPIVYVSAVPRADALLALLRSGRLYVHRWFPFKPGLHACPFTFEPSAAPFAHLADFSPAARAQSGDALSGAPPIAVSGDGRWLLSGGHADCTLRCTSLARSDVVVRARQHAGVITCVDVGADGVTVVTGAADTTVVVWALYGTRGRLAAATAAPRPLHVLCGHCGAVRCVAISSELDLVLSAAADPPAPADGGGGGGGGGTCIVWTAAKGRFVRRLALPGAPRAVAVSHTGSGLLVHCSLSEAAAAADASCWCLLLFSLNGRPLRRVPLDAPLSMLQCTRNGELVVGAEGGVLAVRRLHDLQLLHRYEVGARGADGAPARVSAFALSGENHHAFAATDGGGMVIYVNPLVNVAELERLASELLNL